MPNDLELLREELDAQQIQIDSLQAQLGLFESAFNAQEQLLANMMLGYSEMASTLEHIITTITAPLDDAAKAQFLTEMRQRHRETLAMLQHMSGDDQPGVGQPEDDQGVDPDSPLAEHLPQHG